MPPLQQKSCRHSATISATCCQSAMAEPPAAAGMRDWNGKMVPCGAVYTALTTKWRGQSGIGPKQAAVLDFFNETAVLKENGQTTMGGGAAPAITRELNVITELRLKAEDQSKPPVCVAKYGQINPTRIMKHVLQCPLVSDTEKAALCTGRAGKEPADWLAGYRERERTQSTGRGSSSSGTDGGRGRNLGDCGKECSQAAANARRACRAQAHGASNYSDPLRTVQRTAAQAPTCQSSRRPTRHLTATLLPSSYPR